ncbi:MAG: hypothetical protein ACI4L9_02375 [Candidatus Coproplasma sp.]
MPQKPENVKIQNSRLKQLAAALAYLLLTAALAVAAIWYIIAFNQGAFDDVNAGMVCFIAVTCGIFGAISLTLAIVRFCKLKYDFIFLADDKGIYDYYSTVPLGFIPWEAIENINYSKLDPLADTPLPHVVFSFTDDKSARRGKNFLQRASIALHYNALRLRFSLVKPKREQIYSALYQIFLYYRNDGTD